MTSAQTHFHFQYNTSGIVQSDALTLAQTHFLLEYDNPGILLTGTLTSAHTFYPSIALRSFDISSNTFFP